MKREKNEINDDNDEDDYDDDDDDDDDASKHSLFALASFSSFASLLFFAAKSATVVFDTWELERRPLKPVGGLAMPGVPAEEETFLEAFLPAPEPCVAAPLCAAPCLGLNWAWPLYCFSLTMTRARTGAARSEQRKIVEVGGRRIDGEPKNISSPFSAFTGLSAVTLEPLPI